VNAPARRTDYAAALSGALGLSFSPILVALSQVAPTPVAIFRYLYALPAVALLCTLRRGGRASFRLRGWIPAAALAGVFFTGDLVFWHHAIPLVGAGPATLLSNTQVVWIGLYGATLGDRPSAAFWAALPVLAFGLFLLAGGAQGGIPLEADQRGLVFGLASGLCYAGALICLRRARRAAPVTPEAVLLVELGAALVVALGVGLADGSLPVSLTLIQHLWLAALGLGVQTLAWVAITSGLRALPAHHAGLLLLVQPVGALVLGWWILGQGLDPRRLLGAGLMVAAIASALYAETRAPRAGASVSDDDLLP
jgi:drug/metabolite transporter (DMT)-like permease